MSKIEGAGIARRLLDKALEGAPDYLVPIYEAVRDFGCTHLIVAQDAGPFDLPIDDRPMIAIVGDDLWTAKGPAGFDRRSLKRILQRSRAAVVVASAAHVEPYAAAASTAVLRRESVVIIETRPEQEIPWIAFVQKVCGQDFPMLISSVRGGTA